MEEKYLKQKNNFQKKQKSVMKTNVISTFYGVFTYKHDLWMKHTVSNLHGYSQAVWNVKSERTLLKILS